MTTDKVPGEGKVDAKMMEKVYDKMTSRKYRVSDTPGLFVIPKKDIDKMVKTELQKKHEESSSS